ncbi:uncharacterized protein [Euphorbia lathyris]|uniref:uncharacterized protein n=1 Tax=Euphorbia lathyris TaxID=212925 RepID=UPI0033137B2F
MADPWEEALDLDDSDLPSLRPSKRHHQPATTSAAVFASQPFIRRCSLPQSSQNSQNILSQNPENLLSQSHSEPTVSPRLIPGPAGTVQAAMLRRRKNPNDGIVRDDFEQELIPTQEYIRRAVEDGIEDDDDFACAPWISAVDFIRHRGLVDEDGAIGVPLSAIKSGFNMDKVAQVVAVVKSCTPNGLGGLMVTLKDPTGTIDATIHGRVLAEEEFGKNISIGAVIILKKVSIFSPSRSAHYLNITPNNMVKVFSKDVGVPTKQNHALPMIKHGVPVNGHNEESRIPHKTASLSQGMTEAIMNSFVQNEDMNESSNDDEQAEMSKTTISCHGDGKKKNQNAASGKEQLMAPQDADNEPEEIDMENGNPKDKHRNAEDMACEQRNNRNPSSQAARASSNMFGGGQSGSREVHLNNGLNNQESGNGNGSEGKQPTNSSVSVPEWTDEQLDELFAFE